MASLAEALTRNFYAWELRGRGWQVASYPVLLEPPFAQFPGHASARKRVLDDGRRETLLSSLAGFLFGRSAAPPPVEEEESAPEPEPHAFARDAPIREIEVVLPRKTSISPAAAEGFLLSLASCLYPLAFEVLGRDEAVIVQFAVRLPDRERVIGQLRAFFPEVELHEEPGRLGRAWHAERGEVAMAEFGLAREFMLPLAAMKDFRIDPLLSLFGAVSEVGEGEAGLFQVLFEPASNPWAEEILRAVHTERGEPFFLDDPELTSLAVEKVSRPLFAAAVRVAAKSSDASRAWRILEGVGGGLLPLAHMNELVPLSREEDARDLEDDLLRRVSHRTGMLLSLSELASLVHLPQESVRIEKLHREVGRTKAAPLGARREGVLLGANLHEGARSEVRLPRDLRMRHTHLIGASGTGKSTLLAELVLEDLARGEGVGLIDPHGDLVDEILGRFPEEREGDLILFDPGDEEVSLGWNMLAARSEIEKTLLSSDLVGVFRRLSTSWGDQMNSVLANAILAFLESSTGGTLLELRRFLVDREFRAEFLRTVSDSEVLYYWQKEFPLLVGKPQGPILTRLDTFLRPKLVRRVVVEREHRLDFRGIVDDGRVFLAKLSQGAIGEENAALLGSLLVSAFHQAAITRQDLAPHARRHFFLYLDEFQEIATPSMAALLTGARKYRLGLTLAHQELRQLEARNRDLASAVLANPATRIVFRVGEGDARDLARGFSAFNEEDLVDLAVGEAVARVERADHDFNLKTVPLPALAPEAAAKRRDALRELARAKYPRRAEEEPAREVSLPALGIEPQAEERKEEPRPASRARSAPAGAPAPLGRGGPEHKYLQELVKRWGEAKGFRVTVEEPTPDGRGSVDVVLAREEYRMACEISVTSTVEQEVGNLMKCLAAGFDEIVLLAMKKAHLAKVRGALEGNLSKEDISRFLFLTPEELFSLLDSRPEPQDKTRTVGGYRVNVRYRQAADGDSQRKAVAGVIAKGLGRLRKR
ncbi:MAG TPA: type IV secretion system DNA-binding domain-containing protein [Thermoanaerobaculia bacterium]|nr:type IV secretion system DNA-binding domain-containing protein [Thermoanaerobaculia bacterium]